MSSISSSMMDPAFAASQFQQHTQPNDMRAAAEQFEALFLQQMMAQARKSKLSEDIFSNKGTETYNNLLDQERATELAKTLDLGIAEALMRQFGVAEKE
jgi:flagellar protein FlgJ